MSLQALIVHHLDIPAGKAVSLNLAGSPLPLDDQAVALVDLLKSRFLSRLTRQHGYFSDEQTGAPLPQALADGLPSTARLVDWSQALMRAWQGLMGTPDDAVDIHVFCLLEQQGDAEVFYLLASGSQRAYTVTPDLNLTTTRHVDPSAALFGIKVDLHEWQTGGHHAYLSMVAPRGDRVLSDSLLALTGFEPGINTADTTDALLAGVEAFARQLPAEQVADYRRQVVDYCSAREQADAPVDLAALARTVEGVDPGQFSRVLGDHVSTDDPLMVDRRRLSRYVKFAGREKDLAISFSSSQLNQRVHYDPERDTLSIAGLPRALRDQLLRHLSR